LFFVIYLWLLERMEKLFVRSLARRHIIIISIQMVHTKYVYDVITPWCQNLHVVIWRGAKNLCIAWNATVNIFMAAQFLCQSTLSTIRRHFSLSLKRKEMTRDRKYNKNTSSHTYIWREMYGKRKHHCT
jgi:hypothetical protein